MIKNIWTILILMTILNIGVLATERVGTSFQPAIPPQTVLKNTVYVRTYRDTLYWKAPNQNDFWNWTAGIQFSFTGPLPRGSQLSVDFTLPDGKPWYSQDLQANNIGENEVGFAEAASPPMHADKRGILLTGTFGFKIILKNGLENTQKELYQGKFTVNKIYRGNGLPQFKNQNEYYVEQDWVMPIGYLGFNPGIDATSPPIWASMWFRGANTEDKLGAFLFYNGKQISSTTNSNQGGASSVKSLLTSGNDVDPRWELWAFNFYNVRSNSSPNLGSNFFILSKNPGNYEIKVLRDSELVRTASFLVGADGKMIDNGIAAQNNIAGAMILPVKILGTKDGKWNNLAWKTDAYYGNILNGFVAP